MMIVKPKGWKPGNGSVYQDAWHRRSYYVAAVTVDGKRRLFRCRTQREAWQKLAELKEAQLASPKQSGTNAGQTVDAFLRGWLQTVGNRRPKTVEIYRNAVEHYLAPGFAGIPLKLLTTDRIQRFFDRVRRYDGKGRLAPASVHRLRRVLRTALNFAVVRGYIVRNSAAGRGAIALPEVPYEPFSVWTRAQADAFLKAAEGDQFEAFFRIALMHGLRFGEIVGLEFGDIDFQRGTVSVHKQLQANQLVDMKTNTQRVLSLDSSVLKLLKALHDQPRADGKWADLVFKNSDGRPLNRSNLTQRSFAMLTKKGRVPRITLHDLRHTFGTLHAASGTDLLLLKYLMGHASITTTTKYIRQAALNQPAADANRRLWAS